MSTSMVSTVLEIEREAEDILAKAVQDAEKIISDAKIQRDAATRTSQDNIKKEIESLESAAAADRSRKIEELEAKGAAALKAVTNISDTVYDKGVQFIVKALAEN